MCACLTQFQLNFLSKTILSKHLDLCSLFFLWRARGQFHWALDFSNLQAKKSCSPQKVFFKNIVILNLFRRSVEVCNRCTVTRSVFKQIYDDADPSSSCSDAHTLLSAQQDLFKFEELKPSFSCLYILYIFHFYRYILLYIKLIYLKIRQTQKTSFQKNFFDSFLVYRFLIHWKIISKALCVDV